MEDNILKGFTLFAFLKSTSEKITNLQSHGLT